MQQTFNNRHIWNVAYPIFLGLLAQNIINVTDTAFLGHVGETALGGAAMGGLLYICIYTMAFGFSIGSQILIARRNGEGNYHMIGEIMWQGSAFSFAMAVIMLVLMFMFAEPMIRLFVNSESVYNATYEFFIWRMWGLLFSFINVMFHALYIGITNTKVLTMNAIVMALVNVFLDYAMIFGKCGFPEMGIKGAAIASVIAEASSLVFYIIYTRCKIDIGKYRLNRIGRFRPSIVLRILHISSFTMMQYFLSMAIWFVFFIAIERLGERQLAIANIVRSVYVVLLIPAQSLSTTANTLVSNLIGAGGVDHVMSLLGKIARMSFLIMVVCVGLCALFPHAILAVYTNEAALLEDSVSSLYVVCAAMLIASVANIYFNGISGTGNTQAALYLEVFVLVFYAVYIVVVGMIVQAPVDICFTTELVYYSLMLIISLIYLKKAKWQDKKI